MALENMVSQLAPQSNKPSTGLASGEGLESVTNKGSNLNLDDKPILSNALANDKGLETLTNAGSNLNMDDSPQATLGLANGTGLEAMTTGDSNFDIDDNPTNSNGLNQTQLGAGASILEIQKLNDISNGLAKDK